MPYGPYDINYIMLVNNNMLNRAKAKDSLPKNTNVINGSGVRIIKSCSSNTKSSQVKPAFSQLVTWFTKNVPYGMAHMTI